MTPNHKRQTNRLLGYPEDARLLIINADDFGMCHAVNAAIMRALQEGIVQSTTLMVPCPWAIHAMHFLADHPETPFGIHLTAISDAVDYPWGPVTAREKVPTLVDGAGHFSSQKYLPEILSQDWLDQLEMEFRAQIKVVLAAGLKPTHLDWHSLRINDRTDIFEIMFRLAKEYGLALRVAGQSLIEEVQNRGLPGADTSFLDSSMLDPVHKSATYAKILHELPPGLSEWAVHPGLDYPELLALEPNGKHIRQTDFDFLISQEAKDIINSEGIILLDYRSLQSIWSENE